MHRPLVHSVSRLALCFSVVALAACTERRTAERADSDLAHDLALANQLTTQPALRDTAAAAQPQATEQAPPVPAARPRHEPPRLVPTPHRSSTLVQAPVPATSGVDTAALSDSEALAAAAVVTPQAPAPAPMQIDAGTAVSLTSGMRVCTNTNQVGDKLVATVATSVTGTGGALIPAGSRVVLQVAQVAPGDTMIVLSPTAIYVGGSTYPLSGTVTATSPMERADVPSAGASAKKKLLGGAIAGAILGQILGHDTKSTVIGAAAGAATGAAVAQATRQYQACLPEGSSLTLVLSDPVMLH